MAIMMIRRTIQMQYRVELQYTDRGGGGTKMREGSGFVFVETLYQSIWDGRAFASQPGRPQGPRPPGYYGTCNYYFCGGHDFGGGFQHSDEGDCDEGDCDEGDCGGED